MGVGQTVRWDLTPTVTCAIWVWEWDYSQSLGWARPRKATPLVDRLGDCLREWAKPNHRTLACGMGHARSQQLLIHMRAKSGGRPGRAGLQHPPKRAGVGVG